MCAICDFSFCHLVLLIFNFFFSFLLINLCFAKYLYLCAFFHCNINLVLNIAGLLSDYSMITVRKL